MNKKAKEQELKGRILARVFADDLSKVMGTEADVNTIPCGPGCDQIPDPPATVKLTDDSW